MEKHEFKPKEWVLVRDTDEQNWRLGIYSHYDKDCSYFPYRCVADNYVQCIPYEGNEHLLGTSNSPEEKPNEEFKFGDKVKCKHNGTWVDGLFVMDDGNLPPYLVFLPEENDIEWYYCRKDVRHA